MDIKYKKEYEKKLTTEQVRLMNGVLLGKGRIDKSKGIICRRTQNKEYAEWLEKEFSNIESRVVKIKDKMEFRTGVYDWVLDWRDRWYYKNVKVIPKTLSLSPEMAGVWFYDRGSINETHGRLTLDMEGMEKSCENGVDLLDHSGFDSFESFDTIQMIESETERFLEWMELPPINI